MVKLGVKISQDLVDDWFDDFDYSTISKFSHKKVKWKCSTCEHIWTSSVASRSTGRGCPNCSGRSVHSNGHNSVARLSPQLSEEFSDENEFCLEDVRPGSGKKASWICKKCSHHWSTTIKIRAAQRRGCPACAKKVLHSDGRNSLEVLRPDLAEQLSDDNFNASMLTLFSNQKVNWRCLSCDNQWAATVNNRVKHSSGCPYCSGSGVHIDGRNSMKVTHPELAAELMENEFVHASQLLAGTHKILPWKCSTCSHEWRKSGAHRLLNGCPACSNRAVHIDGRNSMEKTHPELAAELMPNNYGNASTLIASSGYRLPWKCNECHHEWKTMGSKRAYGEKTGCPACAGYGFNPKLPAYYYVLSLNGPKGRCFFKGGITNNEVDRRIKNIIQSLKINKLPLEVEIVEYIKFGIGKDAKKLEDELKSKRKIRATSEDKFSGYKELFSVNPLAYARENKMIDQKLIIE
jgi:Zn finger protein HypA/HybF involved in hydrogenase expression